MSELKKKVSQVEPKPSLLFSVRFLLTIFIFFGWCFNYMQKIDMSIAIVCMINQTAVNLQLTSPVGLVNQSNNLISITSNHTEVSYSQCQSLKSTHHDGPFAWSKSIQGVILSAYFYGYIFTQIAGGWLSFTFGPVKILTLSMGIGSLITAAVPIFARLHYIALIVCLLLSGLANGAFLSSVSGIWAYWAPQCERSRLVGIATAGARIGNIIALMLGSVLCVQGFDGGWPSIFYVFGAFGVTWCVLFFFLNTDSPSNHKFISEKEKLYILEETKKTVAVREYVQKNIPWLKIISSKAIISVFFGHFAFCWGNYLFLTQIPSYLKDVHKFDIKSNGFISSIPYICSSIMIIMASIAADAILKRKLLSLRNVRRIFTLVGSIVPAICAILLSFIGCAHTVWAVVLLTLAVSFDAFQFGAGYIININDIAGPYSGIVFGISNTIASLAGILAPNIASVITKHGTQSEWQIVFIICAIVYFVGSIVDVILLETELQPWAKIDFILDKQQDSQSSIKSIDSDQKNLSSKHLVKF